ncbi:hypothetical protein SO802_023357 [Lithocarpus litseifolius]|uniref:Uncharacterized protein n=1 Tax=Lithocarpus litseifolius TaxID=425828 RepID=A0AAW2C651_9ROSI
MPQPMATTPATISIAKPAKPSTKTKKKKFAFDDLRKFALISLLKQQWNDEEEAANANSKEEEDAQESGASSETFVATTKSCFILSIKGEMSLLEGSSQNFPSFKSHLVFRLLAKLATLPFPVPSLVTTIILVSKTVDDEEDLVESKFEKIDDQDDIHIAYEKLYKVSEKHEKLYRLAIKKLSDVELNQEELSTKFDEANQTIEQLRFENSFLAKRTKKLEAELFQVRAQLERTFSANLDEMLSFQKFSCNRTGLWYDFPSPNIASSSTTVFISPTNNVNSENNNVKTVLASENIDKGKSILGATPKLDKKETRNPRTKKGNNQKPKQKKQHFCHHYGVTGHPRSNCFKWLAT